MKVSRAWLKELVDLKISEDELISLLPLRTIAINSVTPEYLELDMKGYNRADLLSMRGIAYEVSAISDSPVKFAEPDVTKYIWVDQKLPQVKIRVENERLAPVYCLAKIEGLKVGPSEQTWRQKLLNCGMRSVNNVADVTNLVMLEYGQPLHAFDSEAVKDETIIVRNAKKGEKITTLDGKTRDLSVDDLLIADPQNNLGIAGVMGGKDSEVTDSTTTILLEAAIFDPINLRRTSTKLGLASEASKRFYHGLTRKRLLQALDAAIKIYQQLGGKLTAITMVGDMEDEQNKIPLRLEKINKLIGIDFTKDQTEEYLKKLRFTISDQIVQNDHPSWVVTPPYFRLDIEIEEDLIEEIARMYGYEKIVPKDLDGELPARINQTFFNLIYLLKKALVEQKFTEIQTYSYFSTQVLENFGWLKMQQIYPLIKIANPISAETEYLRHNLWSNLVEKAAENLKYFDQVAVFEIGKTYEVINNKIHEEQRLAILLVDGTDNPLGTLSNLLTKVLNSQNVKLEIAGKMPENPIFHPHRATLTKFKDKIVGGMAEIHPRIVNKFGVEKRVAIAEVKLEELLK